MYFNISYGVNLNIALVFETIKFFQPVSLCTYEPTGVFGFETSLHVHRNQTLVVQRRLAVPTKYGYCNIETIIVVSYVESILSILTVSFVQL